MMTQKSLIKEQETKLSELSLKITDLTTENYELNHSNSTLTSKNENLTETVNRLNAQELQFSKEKINYESKIGEMEKKTENLILENTDLKATIVNLTTQNGSLTKMLDLLAARELQQAADAKIHSETEKSKINDLNTEIEEKKNKNWGKNGKNCGFSKRKSRT